MDRKYDPSSTKNNRNKYVRSAPHPNRSRSLLYKSQNTYPVRRRSEKYSNLDDLCCLALVCTQHQRMALVDIPNKGLFFPCINFKMANYSLDHIVQNLLHQTFGINVKFSNFQFVSISKIERIQIPKNENFIVRLTYCIGVNIDQPNKNQCICQVTQRTVIHWFSYDDICYNLSSLSNNLWGPEPKHIFEQQQQKMNNNQNGDYSLTWNEITLDQDYYDQNSSSYFNSTGKMINSIAKNVMKCRCQMNKEEIISLYNEFLLQCYPSRYMTFCSFKIFMEKIVPIKGSQNFVENRIHQYFKSFDKNGLSFLNFNDLLLGLMIVRKNFRCCPSKKDCPCLLMKYILIFRFYSSDHQTIDKKDIFKMALDYEKTRNMVKSSRNFQNKKNIPKKFKTPTTNTSLSFEQFYTLMKDEELFQMFSIEMSVEEFFNSIIRLNFDFNDFMLPILRIPFTLKSTEWITLQHSTNNLKCPRCKQINYFLSKHFLTLSQKGEILKVNCLDESFDPLKMIEKQFRQDIEENEIYLLANDLVNRIHKFGYYLFDKHDDGKSSNKLEYWFFENKVHIINCIKMICQKAEEIFSLEPIVLEVSTPCYIFGDLHGNLKDLLQFEKQFWKQSPFINESKYLFLGDYVDRGQHGVECIIYLFCLKILAPKNFFILRGNHEIRHIQEQFSFYDECCLRFNMDVWMDINKTLDHLPISAIIDGRMFCAHGGIPITINTIEQIRWIPKKIDDPINISNETWEILWNDPISNKELLYHSDFHPNQKPFGNTIRGTAFFYTESTVNEFCAKNNIEFIIRGHEVYDKGFQLHHRGKVITIFSSSKYAELNQAAVVFVDRQKIRIIQIFNKKDEIQET